MSSAPWRRQQRCNQPPATLSQRAKHSVIERSNTLALSGSLCQEPGWITVGGIADKGTSLRRGESKSLPLGDRKAVEQREIQSTKHAATKRSLSFCRRGDSESGSRKSELFAWFGRGRSTSHNGRGSGRCRDRETE